MINKDTVLLKDVMDINKIENLNAIKSKVIANADFTLYIIVIFLFISFTGFLILLSNPNYFLAIAFTVLLLFLPFFFWVCLDSITTDLEYLYKKNLYNKLVYRKDMDKVFDDINAVGVPMKEVQIKWLVDYRYQQFKKRFK